MNYYNEFDPKAAAWLGQLIEAGHIPAGHVDTRSIKDVSPHDLTSYTQCHFFAGIGGWSLALRLAGWPDDRPVWTGSCPCQPFSLGNVNRQGVEDPRHLWPIFSKLIAQRNPSRVFGEQVDDAIREGWLDEVFHDLELEGYSCGAAVLPARSYGAEHWRDRLFWVADSGGTRWKGCEQDTRISGREEQALAKYGNPLAYATSALAGRWDDISMGDGVSVGMVRSIIKGAGNAIVPQVAAAFIEACEQALV